MTGPALPYLVFDTRALVTGRYTGAAVALIGHENEYDEILWMSWWLDLSVTGPPKCGSACDCCHAGQLEHRSKYWIARAEVNSEC